MKSRCNRAPPRNAQPLAHGRKEEEGHDLVIKVIRRRSTLTAPYALIVTLALRTTLRTRHVTSDRCPTLATLGETQLLEETE